MLVWEKYELGYLGLSSNKHYPVKPDCDPWSIIVQYSYVTIDRTVKSDTNLRDQAELTHGKTYITKADNFVTFSYFEFTPSKIIRAIR